MSTEADVPDEAVSAGWTALRSTSMPVEPVSEAVPVSDAPLDSQLLDLFFDRVPMGVAVFDTQMRLLRCNKTWTGFYEHYFGVGPEYTAPGTPLTDLIPGNEESVRPLVENALAGRVVRQAAHHIGIPGIDTYWDVVFAPLFAGGEVVGVVDIVTDATDRVLAFQRLEARITAFTRIAAAMAVDQPLEMTLRVVLASVHSTIPAAAASIVSWTAPGPPLVVDDGRFGPGFAAALAEVWSARDLGSRTIEDARAPRVAVHPGFRTASAGRPLFAGPAACWSGPDAPTWEDLLVVPLTSAGRVSGELHLYLRPGQVLRDGDEAFLVALADQAAVAAQNAALFGTAAQNATLLERQRLARELHDSVSQALFSMTLHARAAERHLTAAGLGPGTPAAGEVARLRELTAGALAEMRALIFELRPGALAEEGLVAALTKQAAALSARTGTPVEVRAPAVSAGGAASGATGERLDLAPDAEEHLYRLALEALNNALKHAEASRVEVVVDRDDDGRLLVEVTDDGRGFDASLPHPGHLGLHTMAERAAAAGGRLDVRSRSGEGTTVSVTVPARVT